MPLGLMAVQFTGYLLQTLPIVLLFYLPFNDEQIKRGRKKSLVVIFTLLLISAAVMVLITQFIYVSGSKSGFLYANAYFLAVLIGFVALCMNSVNVYLLKKLLVAMMLIHYGAILASISYVLRTTLLTIPADLYAMPYTVDDLLLYAALTVLTLPPLWRFFSKTLRGVINTMERADAKHATWLLTALLALFCCGILVTMSILDRGGSSVMAALWIFCLGGSDVAAYYMFFSEIGMFRERIRLNDRVKFMETQYSKISASVEEARRTKHDLRQHLRMIKSLFAEGKYDELENYLEIFGERIQRPEEWQLSGSSTLDSLLKYYINQAERLGIRINVDAHVSDDEKVDPVDLTVLLGNALENALEACDRLTQQTGRRIDVKLKQINSALYMLIENTCEDIGAVDYSDGRDLVSSKSGTTNGCGVRSMNDIAAKYDGEIALGRNGGTFELRVVLNCKAPTAEQSAGQNVQQHL